MGVEKRGRRKSAETIRESGRRIDKGEKPGEIQFVCKSQQDWRWGGGIILQNLEARWVGMGGLCTYQQHEAFRSCSKRGGKLGRWEGVMAKTRAKRDS